jgi:hypothetical protein
MIKLEKNLSSSWEPLKRMRQITRRLTNHQDMETSTELMNTIKKNELYSKIKMMKTDPSKGSLIVEVDKKVNLKKDFEELMVQYENLKSLYEKKSVDVLLLKEKLNKQNSLIDEMKEFIDSVTKVRNIKKRIEKKVFSQ